MIEENSSQKPVMLFGRDLRKIPCFRKSFLYGISSGMGGGIVVFLLTSRVKLATDVAFFSFLAVTGVYWCRCRHKLAVQRFEINQYKSLLAKSILLEGTKDTENNIK